MKEDFLIKTKKCFWGDNSCPSEKKDKELKIVSNTNFYVDAISNDLNININRLNNKSKILQCKKCFTTYNNIWFNKITANKIYSTIYGQHHYGWTNYYNFINKNIKPNHGNLFKKLFKKNKKITYGEFNCPFSGLFFDIFDSKFNNTVLFRKNLNRHINEYIAGSQLAGLNKIGEAHNRKSSLALKRINKLKNNNQNSNYQEFKKYLVTDFSSMCWGQNCISKSVNCKSKGQVLFEYDVININEEVKYDINFDVFGIFMTLDHTFKPDTILNYALKNSKLVVVHAHTNLNITKQHLFSITKNFINYLKSKKIYVKDITSTINKDISANKGKDYLDNQIYFICSRNQNYINKINN